MHTVPPLHDWMSEKEQSFRRAAESNFLATTREAGFAPSSYRAMQLGHSSVVYAFEQEGRKYACKLADHDAFTSDVLFFDACARQSIPALQVYKNLKVHDGLYALFMNFIEAKTLAEVPDERVLQEGKYRQLGAYAARLHRVQGSGFGPLKPNQPLEGVSTDFLGMMRRKVLDPTMAELIADYVTPEEMWAVEVALERLDVYFQEGNKASLCHGDLNKSNIFDTDPIMIFDPGPAHLSHPMLDLALAIVYASASSAFAEVRKQILEGYGSVTPIDGAALDAACVVQAYRKLATALRKKHARKTEAYRALLREKIRELSL